MSLKPVTLFYSKISEKKEKKRKKKKREKYIMSQKHDLFRPFTY